MLKKKNNFIYDGFEYDVNAVHKYAYKRFGGEL